MIAVWLVLAGPASAATWTVGPGQVHTTIGDALAVAGPADIVEIEPGTYTEDVVLPIDDLRLRALGAVTLRASSGSDAVVVSGSGVVLEGLTIDGEGSTRGVTVDPGQSVTLSDCTVRNGDATQGAGLFVADGSTAVVVRTAFENNTASDDGGGIYAFTDSTLRVTDSTFTNNRGDLGGGIACMNSPAVCDVTGSHFEANIGVRFGGALRTEDVPSVISTSTFCNNSSDDGGAYSCSSSNFVLRGNVFVDNAASDQGGAIRLFDCFPTEVVDNHYVGNTATSDGGAIYANDSDWPSVNELLAFNGGGGHTAASTNASVGFDYGLFFGNTNPSGDIDGVTGAGVITGQDPLLTDYQPGTCDIDGLRPGPGSPAIDAGDPARTDPDGTRSDIGAFDGDQIDGDGDGYLLSDDCDDANAAVNPGATEVCNGIDDDCANGPDDGLVFDDWYLDGDSDGYGAGAAVSACEPVKGRILDGTDCDDSDDLVNPGATEVCNGIDDDCANGPDDGLSFDDWYVDADGDGFGAGAAVSACEPVNGRVLDGTDCDDSDDLVNPAGTEVCGGGDEDCDGLVDAADPDISEIATFLDTDGDGFGDSAFPVGACQGGVPDDTDCDDADSAIHPAADEEWYDGVDQNCDGNDDDQDEDGVPMAEDCDDRAAGVYPDAFDIPDDGIDQDCDDEDAIYLYRSGGGCGCTTADAPFTGFLLSRRRVGP